MSERSAVQIICPSFNGKLEVKERKKVIYGIRTLEETCDTEFMAGLT